MEPFRPQRWLRIFGILASCTIALRRMTDQISAGWAPGRVVRPEMPLPALLAFEASAYAGFLAAFLYTTRSVEPQKRRVLPILVLLVQFPLGMIFGTELAFVATAAAPFVLEGGAAWTWLALEVALLWAIILPAATPSNVELSPGLAHTPFPLALSLTLVETTAWILFAFCAGYLIVRAERGRRELGFRNAQLQATQTLLAQSSALNERLRISRELHDTVGHHLVGLSVDLELASHLSTEKALTPVRRAQLVARLLLADIREAVSAMREEGRLDLKTALEQLASGISDLKVHVDVPAELATLDPALCHLFFRCVQEAVTNTRKHASARTMWLSITREPTGYRLRVKDDGRGCDGFTPGNGLRGMRERAEELGAECTMTTSRGHGFAIEIWAPSERASSEASV